ncbi:MAG: nitrogen fixation protein NifM [Pseudomonadota bacterium]
MVETARQDGELAYLLLKTANSLFGRSPAALAGEERGRVETLARRQHRLETLVLSAPEARDVVVPQATLEAALAEIRSRYPDEVELHNDLADNGLTLAGLTQAMERELKVEAILDKEASRAATVSDIDVELYYHYHPEQFTRPETRRTRHILVTINEDMAENHRDAARQRIDGIAARLAKDPRRFEEQALKHSECPTALNGGLLGDVKRGQLYPELDAQLFTLEAGQIGPVVESPVGFHVLFCEAIQPEGKVPLGPIKAKVREMLENRRKQICRKAWLKRLGEAQREAA